jgi:phosphopantetheinyl transferase
MVKIARRFGFSSHEPQAFFDHWTIREALIKAQGLKLLRNPGPIGWTLQKLDRGSGWSAHLAFQGAQDPLETFHVQDFPSELLDR